MHITKVKKSWLSKVITLRLPHCSAFERTYFAYYNQDKLFENAPQCGKRMCVWDVVTWL